MKVQESGRSVKDINKRSKIQKCVQLATKIAGLDRFLPLRRKVSRRKVQLNHNGSVALMSLLLLGLLHLMDAYAELNANEWHQIYNCIDNAA